MKTKTIALFLALAVIITAFAACSKNTPDTGNVDEFFSPFKSETVNGDKVTEEIFKGNKVTMVNVWGTFCSPCIREMPELQKISENYESKGVKVVGILIDTFDAVKGENIPEKVELAQSIIKETGVKYTNILPCAALNESKLNNIFSIPTTYFLDENGKIIGSEYVGSKSYEEWAGIIDSILEA